jgi:hypothetical protein
VFTGLVNVFITPLHRRGAAPEGLSKSRGKTKT